MRETLILTKILLKNSLNKNSNRTNLTFKAIVAKLLIFGAIAYIGGVIAFFSKEIIDVLKSANQEETFISLCLLSTIIIAFIQSILSSLNVLYFSKDIEFLLPLPIKSLKIIFAKLNVMLVSEYIVELLTFAIPFAMYGITFQVSIMFYIMSVLVFLFLPVIPTLLGTVFTVLLMRFTRFVKNKDIVQYLTVFITFAIIIAIQIYSINTTELTDFMLANKLIQINGLTDIFADYFIILKQGINAITQIESGVAFSNILYLIGESVTAYALVAVLISTTYINSATNVVSGNSKKIKTDFRKVKRNSIRKAYIDKEFKILFRNPVFFLNSVLPVLIIPIIMLIPFISEFYSGTNNASKQVVLSAIGENIENTMGFAICIFIINFLYMFNYVSVTSISREGENAIFMKYIPIELYKQCRYKAMPAFILNFIPLLFIVIGMNLIFSKISISFTLEVFIIGLLCNWFISYGEVLIDILKPKLHWTSEYAVVKQNINMLWSTIFVLIVSVIILGICSFFENVHVVTLLISAILILTTIFYDNFIKLYSGNIFKKIC